MSTKPDLKRRLQLQKANKTYSQTPRGKYRIHKGNAARRGVPFYLTFEEWWAIWQISRKWNRRGNRKGKYCMCRRGDVGPYAIDNVYIAPWTHNTAERNRTVRYRRDAPEFEESLKRNGVEGIAELAADVLGH